MPNYVTNIVQLDGDPDRILEMRQDIMSGTLGINHIGNCKCKLDTRMNKNCSA